MGGTLLPEALTDDEVASAARAKKDAQTVPHRTVTNPNSGEGKVRAHAGEGAGSSAGSNSSPTFSRSTHFPKLTPNSMTCSKLASWSAQAGGEDSVCGGRGRRLSWCGQGWAASGVNSRKVERVGGGAGRK